MIELLYFGCQREDVKDVKKPLRPSRSLDLFRKMRLLAEEQRGLVMNQQGFELRRFLDLAAHRERLQNEISADTAKQIPSEGSGNGPSTNTSSVPSAPEIAEVIRSIKEVDREIEDFLAQRCEALYLEIRSIRQGRAAMRGYGAKPSRPPRFIDKEG